jgi:hypothetical protein
MTNHSKTYNIWNLKQGVEGQIRKPYFPAMKACVIFVLGFEVHRAVVLKSPIF